MHPVYCISKKHFYPRPPRGGRHARQRAGGILLIISIHALREEGDVADVGHQPKIKLFLSTPSARRATGAGPAPGGHMSISIHALREEGDCRRSCLIQKTADFYPRPPRGGRHAACTNQSVRASFLSTPSARRATWGRCRGMPKSRFLSTPSARRATFRVDAFIEDLTDFYPRPTRGGRRCGGQQAPQAWQISIHALREEGDIVGASTAKTETHFYPRPPRGGRHLFASIRKLFPRFLSTPSARRATLSGMSGLSGLSDFYPRPPRGGRHYERIRAIRGTGISIHALREEGDSGGGCALRTSQISIHALREEGDRCSLRCPPSRYTISIHALREEGDGSSAFSVAAISVFLSTPSARRATNLSAVFQNQHGISIHALREEGDMPSHPGQEWTA